MSSYFTLLRKNYPVCGLLFLCIIVVYFKTFFNNFQETWDDQTIILACPYLGSWAKLADMFTKPYASQYSPINTLFLNIIYSLFGFKPFAFHAFSLLLHCINAILIIKVAKIILSKTGHGENQVNTYSLIVACIFALHPIQVEAVAWVSASKTLLYTLFTLCGLLAYQRYLINGKLLHYLITITCMILACGSKEQMVVFPFLLLLWDWLNNRKLLDIDLWLEKLPFFIIALGFGFITMQLQSGGEIVLPYSKWDRILFACISFVEYIFKAIVPVNLSYFYPFPMEPGKQLPPLLWIYPVVFAIIIWWGIESLGKERKLAFWGLLFFAINLLPVLHIIPLRRKFIVADRYIYLSIIGLIFVGIDLWHQLVAMQKTWRKVGTAAFCLLLCCYATYSFVRVGAWKDSATLKNITKKQQQSTPLIYKSIIQIDKPNKN